MRSEKCFPPNSEAKSCYLQDRPRTSDGDPEALAISPVYVATKPGRRNSATSVGEERESTHLALCDGHEQHQPKGEHDK